MGVELAMVAVMELEIVLGVPVTFLVLTKVSVRLLVNSSETLAVITTMDWCVG